MPAVTKQKANSRPKPKGKGVLGRISPIGFDPDDGIKINLYGRSGTGKTTLWATFPGQILAIVCSGGSQPGELRSIDTPAYRKKIDQVTIESSSDLVELIDYQKESNKYKTVVLDHATGLQDLKLKEILGIDELPAQKSWGMASQQQYGQCALQMKESLRGLLSLDCNVVIVAQEREFTSDEESQVVLPYVASALTPSVVGWLNPACDYICETFLREATETKEVKMAGKSIKQRVKTGHIEYCLRTAPDPVFTTKFRVPKGTTLPDVIVDPDYNKIMKLIQGG